MMEFKCMWNTEPVTECPPVKELNRLREYEAAIKRLGRFGSKLLRYAGDPRGPEGRAAGKTLAEEATEQPPFRDAEGERWVPVKADVLFELIEENRKLRERAVECAGHYKSNAGEVVTTI